MNNILRFFLLAVLTFSTMQIAVAKDQDKFPVPYRDKSVVTPGWELSMHGYRQNGVTVIAPRFEKAYPFAPNGLALVKENGTYGYINTKGEYILNGLRDAKSFDEFNLAAIKKDKKWGLINTERLIVLKYFFDKIEPFQPNGLAIVKYENKFGLIDTLGNVVLPVIYDKVENFDTSGYAYIKDGDKFGIVDKRGRAVIAAEHKDKKLANAALAEIKAKMNKPDLSLADIAKINNVATTENSQNQTQKEDQQKLIEEKNEKKRNRKSFSL